MNITKDIRYVGVNDHEIDLFEGLYDVPNGMAYNSYAIVDDKVAVMDTVDWNFGEAWLQNLEAALEGREPDYLIVQHMEPDHSANIVYFMEAYPRAAVVASAKAFGMMQGFFGTDFENRRIVVKEGDTLSLGRHTLRFFAAPMVHWPEVIVTYDEADKVLFTADAFGKFGALDVREDWAGEARRYYFGIVGKYGAQAQSLLKKAAKLDIQIICSLHGPVLKENLETYLSLYDTWSSYRAESEGAVVAYASIYGNTKRAAERLAEKLRANGCQSVALYDLARCDMAQAVADAFRFDRLVLASSTYNADVFPPMKTFIERLTERGFQGRTVALIENGAWAPMAAKVMRAMLEGCKNIAFAENAVKLNCAMNEASEAQIDALAKELTEK
ncbi:MAG: FprA family A-type flavoprotein [Clostridia bacterium]|nr:FprA family A-type flavoprotein [Clostridia bacterium]